MKMSSPQLLGYVLPVRQNILAPSKFLSVVKARSLVAFLPQRPGAQLYPPNISVIISVKYVQRSFC